MFSEDWNTWDDEKLTEFHQDVKANAQRDAKIIEAIRLATEANTKSIAELGEGQRKIIDSIEGMVEAWGAVAGTVTVAKALGKFGLWVGSIAFIGAAFKYFTGR